ncbi:hypothetical protein BJX62DRAFT_209591 [Aspergillus germanicus]
MYFKIVMSHFRPSFPSTDVLRATVMFWASLTCSTLLWMFGSLLPASIRDFHDSLYPIPRGIG